MESDCKVTCNSCKKPKDISYVAFESMIEQMERTNHRLFILNIILIILLFAGVTFFFWYESQFEDIRTEQTITQEADNGTNNLRFIGGDYLGEADGEDGY